MQPIDTSLIGNRSKLAKTVGADDNSIIVTSGEGNLFKTKTGNPFYITVRSSTVIERMLVLSVTGDELFVERGQDNTSIQRFYAGACITVEWNPAQLLALIQQNGFANSVPAGFSGIIPPYSIVTVQNGLITKVENGKC